MYYLNLESLISIHSKRWTKPNNHFEKRGVWFLTQICLETKIFRKSRQFWTETQLLGCNKINKWHKKCIFWILKLYLPLSLWVWKPLKLTKLKSVENSSQNSSPGELTKPSAPVGLSLPNVRVRCAKNRLVGCTKLQTDCQILSDYWYGLRIP